MIYVIESPFAATAARTQEEHRIHALKLCRAVTLSRCDAAIVFASHIYVPLFLFENRPEERAAGIEIQKAMIHLPDVVILVWDDWGITKGMKAAIDYTEGRNWEYHKAMRAGMRLVRILRHTHGEVPEWDHLDQIELPEQVKARLRCDPVGPMSTSARVMAEAAMDFVDGAEPKKSAP
jgi:hypothetical protein